MSARDRGSVFLDAMIAAAIVMLSLATMYRAVAEEAAHDRMAENRRMTLLIAQSELSSVGSLIPVAQGITAGLDGPFAWRVEIEPYNSGLVASDAGELWQVTVGVRPRGSNADATVLRSIRVGPLP